MCNSLETIPLKHSHSPKGKELRIYLMSAASLPSGPVAAGSSARRDTNHCIRVFAEDSALEQSALGYDSRHFSHAIVKQLFKERNCKGYSFFSSSLPASTPGSSATAPVISSSSPPVSPSSLKTSTAISAFLS